MFRKMALPKLIVEICITSFPNFNFPGIYYSWSKCSGLISFQDHYSPDHGRDRRYDRRKYRDSRHRDDSADYYSDGDRDKTKEERDQDKKYYSLRKDKERDRRRKESSRDYDRDHRYDTYGLIVNLS